MKNFSFVHAADLHLATPFKGLVNCGQEWRDRLREAPYKAFENIVRLCLQKEVDFLILAGDVYDSSQRNLRAQIRLRDGLARLSKRGIKTYIVKGNHDYAEDASSRFSWPEGVFFFPEGEVGSYTYTKDGQEIVELLGLSYPEQNPRQNFAREFKKQSAAPYTIGILHSNVGGQEGYDNYAPCSLADLQNSEVDYWALGHVHRKLILSEEHPVIAYPGPPQGRSSRETGEKGCFWVQVDQSGVTRLEFVPTAEVLREQIVLEISPWENLDDLLLAVDEAIQEARGSVQYLVAKLEFRGRGSLHQELLNPQTRHEILETLQNRSYPRWQGVYLDELEVNTDPDLDKDAERQSGSITADFLGILDSLRGEAVQDELEKVLAPLFKSKYRRYLRYPEVQEYLELVQKAENIGLDLLVKEGD